MRNVNEHCQSEEEGVTVKLSDGEKLIVLMLSELYEKLEVDGEIDPGFIKSAIFSDNLWGITWKYSGIPFEARDTPTVVREVIDILDMWNFIEDSYERLTDEDKARLATEAKPFGEDPEFRGFDGNYETEHFGAALFIVNDLDRFVRFKGRSLNSHYPSIDTYRRMLPAFSEIRKSLGPKLMTVEQLTIVLGEVLDPSNR